MVDIFKVNVNKSIFPTTFTKGDSFMTFCLIHCTTKFFQLGVDFGRKKCSQMRNFFSFRVDSVRNGDKK